MVPMLVIDVLPRRSRSSSGRATPSHDFAAVREDIAGRLLDRQHDDGSLGRAVLISRRVPGPAPHKWRAGGKKQKQKTDWGARGPA